jgi:hypothetical protein
MKASASDVVRPDRQLMILENRIDRTEAGIAEMTDESIVLRGPRASAVNN